MKIKTKALVVLLGALIALFLGLGGCSLFDFDSPLELERQALRHAQKAADIAQRLVPLLQVGSWEEAYKRTAGLKGELELSIQKLDQAMKKWALKGQSPLRYELDAMEILEEVADNNQYIQDKLSQGEITITTSVQNRLIDKAKENARSLERVVDKIGKAIEKHLGGGQE